MRWVDCRCLQLFFGEIHRAGSNRLYRIRGRKIRYVDGVLSNGYQREIEGVLGQRCSSSSRVKRKSEIGRGEGSNAIDLDCTVEPGVPLRLRKVQLKIENI